MTLLIGILVCVLIAAVVCAFVIHYRHDSETEGLIRENALLRARCGEDSPEDGYPSPELDSLTGIFGTRAFYDQTHRLLQYDMHTDYLIVRTDIDRFKIFNDLFGVEEGDRFLRAVGAAITERCHNYCLYAHLSADHFAFCVAKADFDPDKLISEMIAWLDLYPIDFKFEPNMGIYEIDNRDLAVSIMCDRALLALRTVKGKYAERYAYYDDELRAQLIDEQEIVGEMKQALADRQFEVYFQPQYNYLTGEIIGAEALARWNHPEKGLMSPARFIPLFEKNGFITQLDHYVWEEACRCMHEWEASAGKLVPISVSVNVSRINIFTSHLVDDLIELTEKYGLPTSSLQLEITEGAYMENPEQLIDMVKVLQGYGFIVEMDDFGCGYSSLNTLKDVPVDVLKLDLKFLSEAEDRARGGNILSSIVRMARWLELPLIAEGVETREQAEYLKSIGCTFMQGFHFSQPLPLEEFEKLIVRTPLGTMVGAYADADITDIIDFWDPKGQEAFIFNSCVGAAAICEYYRGNLELLRANNAFFEEVGTTREDYAPYETHVFELFTEGYQKVFEMMLDELIANGTSAECMIESRRLEGGEHHLWLRIIARMLARDADRYIIYLTIENITEQHDLLESMKIRNDLSLSDASGAGDADTALFLWNPESRGMFATPFLQRYALSDVNPYLVSTEHRFGEFVHPDDVAAVEETFERLQGDDGEDIAVTNARMVLRAGGYERCRWAMIALRDDTDGILRALGLIVPLDATEDSSDAASSAGEDGGW